MFNYNLFIKRVLKRNKSCKSFIKNEIAKRLLGRLSFINLDPKNILVTGYNDKYYIDKISKRFPKSNIDININQNKYDIIISNSIIHLTKNLMEELDNYYNLLNNDSILLFSTFGNKSFETLKKSFENISSYTHTNYMIDIEKLGNTLQTSKYKNSVIESDFITFTYEDINILFKDIKDLNEPLADTNMNFTLTGKNIWYKFTEKFKKKLQLEVEVFYGYAIRKSVSNDIVKSRINSNRITLEELKKQISDFKKKDN